MPDDADTKMVLWTDDDIRDFVRDLAEMNGRSANLEMNMLVRSGLALRRAQAGVTPKGDEFAAGLPPDLAVVVDLMAEAKEATVNEFLRHLIETAHTERTLAQGNGTYEAAVARLGVFLPEFTHEALMHEAMNDRRSPAAQALVLIEEALAARRAG